MSFLTQVFIIVSLEHYWLGSQPGGWRVLMENRKTSVVKFLTIGVYFLSGALASNVAM